MTFESGGKILGWEFDEFLGAAGSVHDDERAAAGGKEAIFAESPRVAEVRSLADGLRELLRVGTALRVHDGDHAIVFALAVAGAEAGDNLVRAGDGLGVDHRDTRMQISKPRHLRGAVGIRGPEVMEMNLAAVHIFPARVEDASVGQRPGRVVVFVVAGERADVRAVGVAAMQHGDLREPAVHPALAPAADEDDAAVGKVGGFNVVEGAAGQLLQVAPVTVDFVKVILLRPAGPVAEESFLSVVTHLRIPRAAGLVREERRQFARAKVQAVELRALGVGFAFGVVRVVAEVRIPMTVGRIERARREDDRFHAEHRAVEELLEQAPGVRRRLGRCRRTKGVHREHQQR